VVEGMRLYREFSARVLNVAQQQKFEERPEYGAIRFAGGDSGDFLSYRGFDVARPGRWPRFSHLAWKSSMRKVTIHSKRRIFDGFFKIDEAVLSYEKFDGRMSKPLHRLCFERGDSVAAIVFNRDSRQAILVNQFKYPTLERGPGWIMETVAGMVNANETPESALRREILEEIGYAVEATEHIASFYVSPGGSSERVLLYYAEVANSGHIGPGGGVETEGEDIEAIALSIDELGGRLRVGAVQDAKTIIAIQWLLDRLKADTRE
jgi:nudix-type nucleoside diphosphatase (YffH/AdpP family)